MEVANTAPPFTCFICEGPKTLTGKLTWLTNKGYSTLLEYAKAHENATIMERLKESNNVETQRYHIKHRRDLFSKYAWVTLKSTRAVEADKESAQRKRRCICS